MSLDATNVATIKTSFCLNFTCTEALNNFVEVNRTVSRSTSIYREFMFGNLKRRWKQNSTIWCRMFRMKFNYFPFFFLLKHLSVRLTDWLTGADQLQNEINSLQAWDENTLSCFDGHGEFTKWRQKNIIEFHIIHTSHITLTQNGPDGELNFWPKRHKSINESNRSGELRTWKYFRLHSSKEMRSLWWQHLNVRTKSMTHFRFCKIPELKPTANWLKNLCNMLVDSKQPKYLDCDLIGFAVPLSGALHWVFNHIKHSNIKTWMLFASVASAISSWRLKGNSDSQLKFHEMIRISYLN